MKDIGEVLDPPSQPEMELEIKEHIMKSSLPIDGQVEDVTECVARLLSQGDADAEDHLNALHIREYLSRYEEKVLT